MGREYEMKFRLTREQFDALRLAYPALTPIRMETTYYDTPDAALSRLRWTLRRRMENGVSVCTLKTPLPDGGRGEWEIECGEIRAAIPGLLRLGAPVELGALTEGELVAVCGARFTRLAGRIPTEDGSAELALDEGILTGGGNSIPLLELEIELKEGSQAAAWLLAEQIAQTYELVPEYASKYRRALALTGNAQE